MVVTLHMVSSLDGYAASKDENVSWMNASWSNYDKGEELTSDDIKVILSAIDGYIIGSKTYKTALKLGWPYGDTRTIVVTSKDFSSENSNVEFYSGNLKELAKNLSEKNIWLTGGPSLCQEFLRLNLVDVICLTIAPILLGQGVSLFSGKEHKLQLTSVRAFKDGLIDLSYEVLK